MKGGQRGYAVLRRRRPVITPGLSSMCRMRVHADYAQFGAGVGAYSGPLQQEEL